MNDMESQFIVQFIEKKNESTHVILFTGPGVGIKERHLRKFTLEHEPSKDLAASVLSS